MSTVDQLIQQLRDDEGAEFDSAGEFSLDREKAREKMRQYQLADPHRYVAVLVEAAVLKGATRIDFDIDADDMRMVFDGQPFSSGDVDELYTSLFAERRAPEILARRELAVGLNAAMALNPRQVVLESADSQGRGVRVRLHPSQPDEIEEVVQGLAPGTKLHLRARYRPGLMLEFFRDLAGTIAEEVVLRRVCRHASIEINLDGRRISQGLRDDLVGAVAFHGPGFRGVVGLCKAQVGTVVLLSRGVRITQTTLDLWPAYFGAMVDCEHLEKDVSQSDFIRDAKFDQVSKALRAQVLPVLAKLVDRLQSNSADGFWDDARLREFLVGQFHALSHESLVEQGPPAGRLADVPAWRTTENSWLTTRHLHERDHDMGVPYLQDEKHFEGWVPPHWPPVLGPRNLPELQSLERTFGARARDVTSELRRARAREKSRRAWRSRVQAPKLPAGVWWHRVEVGDGEKVRGEVGLRAGEGTQVRLIVDGCLLCSLDLDIGLDGVVAVVEGGLRANKAFDGVKHDDALARIGIAVLESLPRLFGQSGAGTGEVAPALAYMRAVTQETFSTEFLRGLGFSGKGCTRWLGALGQPALLAQSVEEAGPPSRAEVFPIVRGRGGGGRPKVSLEAVAREISSSPQSRVRWLAPKHFAGERPPFMMLQLDAADRRVLHHFFGSDALVDGGPEYSEFLAEREFMRTPKIGIDEPGAAMMWTQRLGLGRDTAEVEGWVAIDRVALAEWSPGQPRKAEIAVRLHGRVLGQAKLSSPLPASRAVMQGSLVRPNAKFDGVKNSWVLRDALLGAQVRILDALLAAEDGTDSARRQLLMASLMLAFPTAAYARAYRRLRRIHEGHALADVYEQFLAIVPRVSLRDATAALELAMGRDAIPDFDQVVDLLEVGRKKKRSAGRAQKLGASRRFTQELLPRLPALMEVGLLPNADRDGPWVSAGMLEDALAKDGKVGFVASRTHAHRHASRTIAFADSDGRNLLRHLYYDEEVELAEAWVAARVHEHSFSCRPEIELRLPEAECIFAIDVEHDGIVGQVGIPPTEPTSRHAAFTLCTKRRPVEVVPFTLQLPLVAVLDDPQLPVSDDFESVRRTERTIEIANLGVRSTDQILLAVAEQFEGMGPLERSQMTPWILRYLHKNAVGSNGDPTRVNRICAALFDLQLFSDTSGGPLSIADMGGSLVDGKLFYVRDIEGHSVPAEGTVVVVERYFTELGSLFWSLEDYGPRWAELERGALRRRQARTIQPERVPDDALCTVEVDWSGAHRLWGHLWIRPGAHGDRIDFHEDGRVIESRELASRLPVGGVVTGTFDIEADFTRAKVELAGIDALVELGCRLYEDLAAQVSVQDGRTPHRAKAIRSTLAAVAMDLHERSLAERRGPLERLYKTVRTVPVFELGTTGRRISLALALRSRPLELAHLQLWKGGSSAPRPPSTAQAEAEGLGLLAALMGRAAAGASERAGSTQLRAATSVVTSDSPPASLTVPDTRPPKPRPKPKPEPKPKPKPKAPSPDVLFLERIRAELKLAREGNESLLSDPHLDRVRCERDDARQVAGFDDDGVFIDLNHPLVKAAIELGEREPVALSIVVSSVYTALNRWQMDITDDHEAEFLRLHTAYLVSRA